MVSDNTEPKINETNNRKNRYLFYVTLSYSFSILRPIEAQIKKQGGEVAWFIPDGAEAANFLSDGDNRLSNVKAVKRFNSDAVLAPGNYIPDFFPGVKVQVFHGFDSGKKNKFNIRGFFDLYCTQGPNITQAFNDINDGTCEIKETGWGKLDALFTRHESTFRYETEQPLILYAPTFSPKLTSTHQLLPEIVKLLDNKPWHWLVKLHPKASAEEIKMFKALECEKLCFVETAELIPLLQAADVLLSDTSSVLAEFALQQKPVVAMNNRRSEPWMLNFTRAEQLEEQLNEALSCSAEQLEKINRHCNTIHPLRDGLSSMRTLKAINEMIEQGTSHLKAKPLNFIRRLKIRKKLNYYKWK
jgi:hypothetical protein